MVLKQGENTLRVANKYKNLFFLKIGLKTKAMLVKKIGKPPICLVEIFK